MPATQLPVQALASKLCHCHWQEAPHNWIWMLLLLLEFCAKILKRSGRSSSSTAATATATAATTEAAHCNESGKQAKHNG
ncbi:hypothetical protein ACLKA6_010036 [Drosophila palustris]